MGFITEENLVGRVGDIEADAYQLTLYALAIGLKAQLIYEIGLGQSTLALLRAVERTGGHVITCDWNDEHPLGLQWEKEDRPWTWVKTSSKEWVPTLTECADLVYIDGTHTYDAVDADVHMLWPLVCLDGLLVMHDTRSWDGPQKLLLRMKRLGYEVMDLPYCQGLGIVHQIQGL
jgi:hypothetical protein